MEMSSSAAEPVFESPPRQPQHSGSLSNLSYVDLGSPIVNPNAVAAATTAPTSAAVSDASSKVVVKRASRRMSAGAGQAPSSAPNNTRLRNYKSASRSKWVTREIAALEFLLGIPLEAERDIVSKGWIQQQHDDPEIHAHTQREVAKAEFLEPPTHRDTPPVHSQQSQMSNAPHSNNHSRWWDKWVNPASRPSSMMMDELKNTTRSTDLELEQPPDVLNKTGSHSVSSLPQGQQLETTSGSNAPRVALRVVNAPGRRLQGDDAIRVQIPILDSSSLNTQQKDIARLAATREWESKVAHGIGTVPNAGGKTPAVKSPIAPQKQTHPPMLDGRLFFSAGGSYPLQVFSMLRYEPKKEEAIRRRQKLEARGGGGTQFFIMPARDWRGISYRALLPSKKPTVDLHHGIDASLRFDRFASKISGSLDSQDRSMKEESDHQPNLDDDTDDSEEEDTYTAGLLDDPEMVQGRHRNVMIGDRVSGPIVSSTIQFVNPNILKNDLNKQFRDRFDGWEPPKSQRKYIGAKVFDGVYTLMEPGATADDTTVATIDEEPQQHVNPPQRKRQGSISSMSTSGDAKETIRMPPSLTLSKIRSMKRQLLQIAVDAQIEISSVALAIVYFERLCLDCRVDKTNRRLSFAACLLLAIKMNEPHVELIMTVPSESSNNRLQSLLRPAKKRSIIFASLLEFFTQDWNLSLKHLFAAEWGVFAALQFRLHAKPSQVAFHYKRLLKVLGWNPRGHLGDEVYGHWQDALAQEEYLRTEREERREARRQRKERAKLRQLQRELDAANHDASDMASTTELDNNTEKDREPEIHDSPIKPPADLSPRESSVTPSKSSRQPVRVGIGSIFTRFAGSGNATSSDKGSGHKQKSFDSSSILNQPKLPETVTSVSDQDYDADDGGKKVSQLQDTSDTDDDTKEHHA
eukprot:Nitzschia sp. Nitz4//scaffold10_size219509//137407//140157//NITZ4_001441-RA/size219509-processed-gene-0.85-mRNA-1//1//CDS//3329532959//8177//frame0